MMRRPFISILFLLLFALLGKTQNLIPDSSLDGINANGQCPPNYLGINYSEYWYNVSSGSVDIYLGNCTYYFDQTGVPNPNYLGNYPSSPNSFIGLWGVYKTDFTTATELIATPLTETLIEDRFYYFSVDTRYRGKWHPYGPELQVHCDIEPARGFDVYTSNSNQEFGATIDEAYNIVGVDGDKILTLFSEATTDSIETLDWSNLSACFVANGGEKQIAIGTSINSYEPIYPCDTNRHDKLIFSLYYFNLDNITLIPFPSPTEDTLLLCSEIGEVALDVRTYFNPQTLDAITFVWEDGFEGEIRTFEIPGIYHFDAMIECGSIPFDIIVEEKKCNALASVPSAFTPNQDGINDELFPFFLIDFPISNYEFTVFDRWGNICYRSNVQDDLSGWDGKINGQQAMMGTYIWTLSFDLQRPEESERYHLFGDVTLIR